MLLEAYGLDFGSILKWFGMHFGLILVDLGRILAGAACCFLLLSWSLSSKSVLAVASCCLLGRAFAP